MDKERIRLLIEKFNSGELNENELNEIEDLIENGLLSPVDFPGLMNLDKRLDDIVIPGPAEDMNRKFYAMLDEKIRKQSRNRIREIMERIRNAFVWDWALQPVLAVLLIFAGFFIGYLVNGGHNKEQISRLSEEVYQVHEMLMINLLKNPEASDRLKAVDLTSRMHKADDTVIDALLNTLDHDENINVRLSAIDALYKYSGYPRVRKGLVVALSYQESPMVLVSLADVLVSLQEKSSIEKLRSLLNEKNLNDAVKNKLRDSIKKMS